MQKLKNKLILLKEDFKLLKSYLNARWANSPFERKYVEALRAELGKANIVNKEDFPMDVVRLNSQVKIKTKGKEEIMEFSIVAPDKANFKEKKISIMAPIGTALIGFRQGQVVNWVVPGGKKTFTILEVCN